MPVQIFPAMQEYLPAVLDLLLSQQERHYRLDPRLHLRTKAEVEARLAMWQQRVDHFYARYSEAVTPKQ